MVGSQQLTSPYKLLVFGASGAIGKSITEAALARNWDVYGVARTAWEPRDPRVNAITLDPTAASFQAGDLAFGSPYHAVCWAQGANTNDSIYDVDVESNLNLYRANCLYILITLQALLTAKLLHEASRFCVISSIWQMLARQSKLSYCMTKAALQGLVLSAAADLAKDGHLINAILPGALDTEMTRRNLSSQQIETLASATQFKRLPTLASVASLACYLCSRENEGLTGQFIAADLGFSHVRLV